MYSYITKKVKAAFTPGTKPQLEIFVGSKTKSSFVSNSYLTLTLFTLRDC